MASPRETSIDTYRARRDFAATPEPPPGRTARRRAKTPIFVVQKHDASRLHYDFRLEHKGVLLSWAVPKGPSLDPADKRLAVHVEDHPLDYADFHGTIPEGHYGAGTVEIWDRGTWAPVGDADAGLAKGELKFTLAGDRLHGRFVLIRLKPRPRERAENWLLIKEHDAEERPGGDAGALEQAVPAPAAPASRKSDRKYGWKPPPGAERAPLPAELAPMLASNVDAPPEGAEWVSEIKFDGYRLLVFKDGATVRVMTRNKLDWTNRFTSIAKAVAGLPAETALLDGEVVALRPDGVSSFPDLQAALTDGRDRDLVFYAFDCLYREGWDLRACTLADRKEALAGLALDGEKLRLSEHIEDATPRVREKACAMGLEGIICKRADSPYKSGRSHAWLKLKCQGREEFVVLGYTPPAGSRVGLGSLHLGFYAEDGALHYVGGVGTGFSDEVLRTLAKRLAALAGDPPAHLFYADEAPPRDLVWVKPELVAEVQFIGWTGAGRVRHAVFLGLREDKRAAEVVREVPNPELSRIDFFARASHSGRIVRAKKPVARAGEVEGVRITHPERELWPGITKQDLAEYWHAVAETALPGIADRPLALVRCPDGIGGEHFFQKHANRGMPDALHEGEHDGAPYLALQGETGLLACAQMSAIELHTWGSTEADAGRPDRLVFDLDPGEGTSWADVIAAAHDLRARLETEGFASFPRTSGGKGLHIVVPLVPAAGWDAARPWCRAFAERMEREAPETYVASVPKARRHGRILIDWLRNGLGSTAVASFSPRARPNATVATPLAWREVTAKLDPQAFTTGTVPARLRKAKKDPWEGFAAAARPLAAEAPPPPKSRKKR